MEDSAPDISRLLHASSVYLDAKVTQAMAETENIDTTQSNSTPSDDVQVSKPRKKTRQERAERVAAEQAIWVRQKFDLPDTEQLIASFSAALVRSILLQGRVHITSTKICFYAKLFGRITKEAFPFSQLARVKKRRGGFVANAIKIYFLDDSVSPIVIGSLNHRDRAFSIIQERLRELNPGAAQARDGDEITSGASVTNSFGGESEERSLDDEDFAAAENESGNGSIAGNCQVAGNCSSRKSRPPLQKGRDVNLRATGSDSSELSSRKSLDVDPAPDLRLAHDRLHPDGPPLVWRTMHDVVDRVYGKAYEKKTERARGLLHAPVKQVFNVIFVSDWLKHYHDSTNNQEVTFTDWYRGEDGFMVRDVTFKKPLGYKIGPKETRVQETQRYSFTEEGGVIVELEGQNLDAPYGDYFICESFFELIPQGDATLLIASIAVHFRKSTILRGKIESGALSETKIAFQRLFNLASKRIEEHIAATKAIRGGAQKRHTDSIPGATPTSPTKKLRSSESSDVVIPAVCVSAPKRDVAKPGDESTSENREAMQPQSPQLTTSTPSAVQMHDSASTRTLRIAAISALITVCILLVAVLLLLNKMRNDVSALEKLVAATTARDAVKCVASTATGGTG